MSPNNQFTLHGFDDDRVSRSEQEVTDIDTAIQMTGFGRFHYKIVSVCALCLLTNGMQNGLSSYVFPAAQCSLQLTSAEIGFLNVSFLIGGVSSAFLWGSLADLSGRRKILLISLILSSIITAVSAFITCFEMLLFCRYFNGFLIGAPGSITFNYLAEFHGPKHRAKSVCYSGVFFTGAWLLLPILAYLVIPLKFIIPSWRLFLFIVAVPEFIAGLLLILLPESPKYLAEKGDFDGALEVLKSMYRGNKGGEFPVKCLGNNDVVAEVACVSKIKRIFGKMLAQTKRLFTGAMFFITMLIGAITFCNMFGYFGLGLWLPELFLRFEQYHLQFPNSTVTVKYLASLGPKNSTTCSPEFNYNQFQSTAAIGTCALLGNFISGWISDKVSLKLVPLTTMIFGAISSGSIYWLRSSVENLSVACIFQGSMATANVAIGSVAVELFPTSVAAMGLCMTIFVGRIGAMISNMMFGMLMDSRCEIPIFLVSGVLFLGSFLCMFIPNRRKVNWLGKNKIQPDISIISTDKI